MNDTVAYVTLRPEAAAEKISNLCQFADKCRTDYDPEDATRLSLGPSAYCYRNVDEDALVAFEDELNGSPAEDTEPDDLRAARNRRYYLKRKAAKRPHWRLKMPPG